MNNVNLKRNLLTSILLISLLALTGCQRTISVATGGADGHLERWIAAESQIGKPNQTYRAIFRDTYKELIDCQSDAAITEIQK